jgi:hypothetical protein
MPTSVWSNLARTNVEPPQPGKANDERCPSLSASWSCCPTEHNAKRLHFNIAKWPRRSARGRKTPCFCPGRGSSSSGGAFVRLEPCEGKLSRTVLRGVRAGTARAYPTPRHEVAFDTAWLDGNPDQVLRVAAGIPRKQAFGGAWCRNHGCQRSEAFQTMPQAWQPQVRGTVSAFCFWTRARKSAGSNACGGWGLAPSIMRTTTMLFRIIGVARVRENGSFVSLILPAWRQKGMRASSA